MERASGPVKMSYRSWIHRCGRMLRKTLFCGCSYSRGVRPAWNWTARVWWMMVRRFAWPVKCCGCITFVSVTLEFLVRKMIN
jgi:hypothetical protein